MDPVIDEARWHREIENLLAGLRPDRTLAVRISGVGLGQDLPSATCDGFSHSPSSGMSGGVLVKV